MKRSLSSLALSAVVVLSSASNAAVTAGELGKIGFVNFEVAFSQEQEAQRYTKELENDERKIAEDEQKARVDIEAKMNAFKAGMSTLNDKARQDKETALSKEIELLQQQFTQRRTELNQKRQHILQDLENKNRLIIDSIAREKKYRLVLNKAVVIYSSPEANKEDDLTPMVVERVNKAYPVKAEGPKKATTPAKKAGPEKK